MYKPHYQGLLLALPCMRQHLLLAFMRFLVFPGLHSEQKLAQLPGWGTQGGLPARCLAS
jgi:hypothetical protein